MIVCKAMPQFFSAAFFIVGLLLAPRCNASEDTLKVDAAGFSQQSLVGVWNVEKNSRSVKDGHHSSVVVWFHGGMTSGNCAKGLVAGGDLAEMLPNFIVMSASACRQDHWVTPVAVGWVDAALDSIARRRGYLVDDIYLVGISDGSLGVLAYSIWGRRRVVSRLLMSSYGAAFGEASQIAVEKRLQTGRWRFIQGGSDRLYPAGTTVPWITQFCDEVGRNSSVVSGVQCDLKFDQAGEHDWSYWKNRRKDWILELFKEK